jgi:DNA-binding MarR family transcriptional regulator
MKKTAVESLVKELYGLGTVRRELARHALAELGSQGFTALVAVQLHGPIRVSEVAGRLGVDLSVASRQVSALAKAGYVVGEADDEDGRALLLTTTDAGRRALQESHRRMVHVFSGALEGWSESDVMALSDGLARLRTDFEAASTVARAVER